MTKALVLRSWWKNEQMRMWLWWPMMWDKLKSGRCVWRDGKLWQVGPEKR